MTSLHPPKIAFEVPSSTPGVKGLAFYCPTCTHWLFRWFEAELMPAYHDVSERWSSRCPLMSSHNPLQCNGYHDLIVQGPAPQGMLEWLAADKPDWPKAPEDFDEGEEQ